MKAYLQLNNQDESTLTVKILRTNCVTVLQLN